MRNPNGYGTVAKLSGNRRRPYIVKKVIGWNDKGHPIYDIVGYTETREAGNMLLAEYNRDPWDVDRAKITLSTGELFAWTFVIIVLSAAFEKLFLALLDKAVARAAGEEG